MTEDEWLPTRELAPMLEYLQGHVSERKQRLFAIACCRSVWDQLSETQQRVVQLAELYADGQVPPEDLQDAWRQIPGGQWDE